MPLTTGQRDVKLTHSNGAGKKNLFLSSSPSVNIWQHPSALLSRVAETARILAQNKSILLAKSVTKKLDHNNSAFSMISFQFPRNGLVIRQRASIWRV